jgi:hypothetical protein
MAATTDELVSSFASRVKTLGVPIREQDNKLRVQCFEDKLPKRLPQSFATLLSRYSFPTFDVLGISLFGWDSDANPYTQEASAVKGSLSELMLPVGYVQIGRPDTGDFDAVCFDLNDQKQNREHRIVQIDHEDILCNWKVRVSGEVWPSFIKLMECALASTDPRVYYEDPIV